MDMGSRDSLQWTSLDEIAADVLTCVKCRLSETRTNAVPGDGSPVAAVLFIGEGPGQNEDEQGLPFVGRAGRLLDSMLAEAPLAREDVFITNVVKCRPPGNRDPQPDEVAACMPYLQAQITLLRPRVIVTLGRHSMARFYPEGKISRDHGRIIDIGGRVLLPLYHPAAALRNPALVQTLREDIKRIPEAVRQSILLSAGGRKPRAGHAVSPAEPNIPAPTADQPASQNDDDHGKGQMSLF
jgi:DNA polymerase